MHLSLKTSGKLGMGLLLSLNLLSCTATKPNHVANNGRVQPDAYNRQQYLDYRGPSPLTTDQSSPWKDVRLKSDGVALNTMTF